jgi:glycosyltransferase involved in cell wall biosynthesis
MLRSPVRPAGGHVETPIGASTDLPRILWLHSHFLNWTGGHQYVYEVVKRLCTWYDVALAASAASGVARGKLAEIDVDLQLLNVRSTNSAAFWLTLPFQLRQEAARVRGSIHTGSLRAIVSSMFPMNVLAEGFDAPHIYVCWEPYALFWDNSYLRSFKPSERVFCRAMRLLYARLDLQSTRSATRVLTLSNFNKRWIDQIYGRDDARVTYEGVDTDFFKPTPTPSLERAFSDQKIVLHSTDFTSIKGTEHLIRALPLVKQAVPDLKVVVTHTLSNPHQHHRLLALARELGVADVLEFVGRVEYAMLPAYYTHADVVVQPSVNQSMSLSVKEAMACATPVVTSLEGYEQTSNGDAGFLANPRDPAALASAITRILEDDQLARRMGERGREIARTRFSWDAVAAAYRDTIEDLL